MYAQKYVITTTLIVFTCKYVYMYILQRWSPQGHPCYWHVEVLGLASKLKSLALKPTSPRKCPVLGSRTPLFFEWLKKENNKAKDSITASLSICGFSSAFEK